MKDPVLCTLVQFLKELLSVYRTSFKCVHCVHLYVEDPLHWVQNQFLICSLCSLVQQHVQSSTTHACPLGRSSEKKLPADFLL